MRLKIYLCCCWIALCGGWSLAQERVQLRPDGGLQVGGRPFVPVIAWAQPSGNLKRLRDLGFNAVHVGERESEKPLVEYLDEAKAQGIYALIDDHRFLPAAKDHPAVLAWLVEHEPETIRKDKTTVDRPPDVQKQRLEKIRAQAPGALTWAIYTAGFYGHYRKIPIEQYREYFRHADVLAFDHYPVTGWNRPDRLAEVGLATGEMVHLARGGQPVWTFLEASDQELTWTAPETRGPTPAEMRAEVWSSIANGARGIGYFTISFGRGERFQFLDLTPEMERELREVNEDLQELAGPIAAGLAEDLSVGGDETDDEAARGHAIQAMRREYGGKVWIVATNVTRKGVHAEFVAKGVEAGELSVRGEGRVVRLSSGRFSDDFEPLAVHIYTDEK